MKSEIDTTVTFNNYRFVPLNQGSAEESTGTKSMVGLFKYLVVKDANVEVCLDSCTNTVVLEVIIYMTSQDTLNT